MSDKLHIDIEVQESQVVCAFKGVIDEDADFTKLSEVKGDNCVFDFDEVSMINSCGIREWIKFIEKLPESITIRYRNCRQIIIEQINMVHGFIRPGAKIESFYAPYYCEGCDDEFKQHIKTDEIEGKKAPHIKCPNCGSEETEFDAIEAQYFAFLDQ